MSAGRAVLIASKIEDEGARSRGKLVHRVVKCGGCWWDRRPHYHCYCGRMIFSVGTHLKSAQGRGERVDDPE